MHSSIKSQSVSIHFIKSSQPHFISDLVAPPVFIKRCLRSHKHNHWPSVDHFNRQNTDIDKFLRNLINFISYFRVGHDVSQNQKRDKYFMANIVSCHLHAIYFDNSLLLVRTSVGILFTWILHLSSVNLLHLIALFDF